ncbi:NADPH dependent diflavin oxidoreductase-like protein 1 [Rhizodiscina lignyota]|uniref:NADPH-dependent diflavin oxidoreductase 1 n=1 Tax=Rhizodiscina lignyota TaxID=1504668 RepID=A0A9P4ILQ8_9PEZI|nr:NADPH dependent diflavin oxidoreductase-like protein 1 [Rhizodiscina lignyota]
MLHPQEELRHRTALILYGTETGNAQDVAEELGRLVERLHFSARVTELDGVTLKELLQYQVVIIAISTTGQGDLPANALSFWKSLRSARLRPGCLQRMQFVSFGLGDTSYPQFNFAHRKLYNRLVQLGAHPLYERGESDEQHPEGIDGTFLPWALGLRQRLVDLYPLPNGFEPIPDDVLLEPKWKLELSSSGAIHPSLVNGAVAGAEPDVELPPVDLLPTKDTITVSVNSNTRLTTSTHWQDVRHLTLSSHHDHQYMPGDTLTIYPKNFPTDVDAFLTLTNWENIADAPLSLSPSAPNADLSVYPPHPLRMFDISETTLTIRWLFTNVLDIMAIPRRSFFSRIAHFTTDEFQRDRLLEFTNPEYLDELFDYTTRPRRSILEVLQEFDTVKLPLQHILDIIPVMRGRQFSIASGGALKRPLASEDGVYGTRFELLIAIVKYRTVIKRIRQGVCTRYIASLKEGQQICVKLQKGGLGITEKDAPRPVIMIGPGTGVAPMRALIYERQTWNTVASAEAGKDILFFGCRNENHDYFFQDEWKALEDRGKLEVHAAFSRDQRQKVYVQDLVRQSSPKIYDALHNRLGIVYICGSSGKMPQAVREALIEAFQKEGSVERADAEAYLMGMEKEGRYKQETW